MEKLHQGSSPPRWDLQSVLCSAHLLDRCRGPPKALFHGTNTGKVGASLYPGLGAAPRDGMGLRVWHSSRDATVALCWALSHRAPPCPKHLLARCGMTHIRKKMPGHDPQQRPQGPCSSLSQGSHNKISHSSRKSPHRAPIPGWYCSAGKVTAPHWSCPGAPRAAH